jgi:DNA (cytosine-5)-methyltransferase 1
VADQPLLLDLFCGQGGASKGYADAGFQVLGVDRMRQPRYPFAFVQADALTFLASVDLGVFVAIHASPPCQAYSRTRSLNGGTGADLLQPTRDALIASGLPYVVENVEGAPLVDPVMLCGAMFPGLQTYRHRLFETNWPLLQPRHPPHRWPQAPMGKRPNPGQWMSVVGNFQGVDEARRAMGCPWMSTKGLREAIPPAYTRFVGRQLLRHLREEPA